MVSGAQAQKGRLTGKEVVVEAAVGHKLVHQEVVAAVAAVPVQAHQVGVAQGAQELHLRLRTHQPRHPHTHASMLLHTRVLTCMHSRAHSHACCACAQTCARTRNRMHRQAVAEGAEAVREEQQKARRGRPAGLGPYLPLLLALVPPLLEHLHGHLGPPWSKSGCGGASGLAGMPMEGGRRP